MADLIQHLLNFQQRLQPMQHRHGIVVDFDTPAEINCLLDALNQHRLPTQRMVQWGGQPRDGIEHIPLLQARHFLGQECHYLIVDLTTGFDANSFNAILGTLVGAGLCLFLDSPQSQDPAILWFRQTLTSFPHLSSHAFNDNLPISEALPASCPESMITQSDAVDAILQVVQSRRKRPLVLTADRGRGKTSAMGFAVATLFRERKGLNVIVTAPSFSCLQPLWHHAMSQLSSACTVGHQLHAQDNSLIFMPPDALISERPECDLLFIDEAAAIPIGMLQACVECYSKLVLSTTIHGYEGCGRGLTLKLLPWMHLTRPQTKHLHLQKPIRWGGGDPLEQWQFKTFAFNASLPELPQHIDLTQLDIEFLDATQLIRLFSESSDDFSAIFALLVNAHYQTTPNDLLQLLTDTDQSLYVARYQGLCVGCLVCVREGGLSEEAITRIQHGTHRPRGHMIPVTLVNQLGQPNLGVLTCERVMRIAVHPQLERQGIGRRLIQYMIDHSKAAYIATSYGVTAELIQFWSALDFVPVKMGSRRDQTSGCYSMVMIYQGRGLSWLMPLRTQFTFYFLDSLQTTLCDLSPSLVRRCLKTMSPLSMHCEFPWLILENYAQGGSNYESVAPWMKALVMQHSAVLADDIDDVIVMKILQGQTWPKVAIQYHMTGRKQVESALRQATQKLLSLQCKLDSI